MEKQKIKIGNEMFSTEKDPRADYNQQKWSLTIGRVTVHSTSLWRCIKIMFLTLLNYK